MKLLSPRVHGYLDYLLVALFAVAPFLFDLAERPAILSWIVGLTLLVVSLLTAYPLGMVRVISFPAHGALELLAAIFLVLSPWVLGYSDEIASRNFFLLTGLTLLGVWAVTDYRAAGLPVRPRREREA